MHGHDQEEDDDSILSGLRFDALKPVAGEPVGQVLYSQGSVKGVGVLDKELLPDWFRAGAERMTLR